MVDILPSQYNSKHILTPQKNKLCAVSVEHEISGGVKMGKRNFLVNCCLLCDKQIFDKILTESVDKLRQKCYNSVKIELNSIEKIKEKLDVKEKQKNGKCNTVVSNVDDTFASSVRVDSRGV